MSKKDFLKIIKESDIREEIYFIIGYRSYGGVSKSEIPINFGFFKKSWK